MSGPRPSTYNRLPAVPRSSMVTEMSVGDQTVYQCEECGETYESREAAEEHEPNCLGPATM